MMKYFDDDNGYYRNHGEGVKRGNEVIYSAPQSILVPSIMKSLFDFMIDNENKIHPLILSCVFHYYFVYIHPFSDEDEPLEQRVTYLQKYFTCNMFAV